MRYIDKKIAPKSDYYVYTPSVTANKIFFYPLITGYIYYEPDYHLSREKYDSYLIMIVTKGSCSITYQSSTFIANKDDIVILNCYQPHSYGSQGEWEALWLHFDGILAHEYYQYIENNFGVVIKLKNLQVVTHHLDQIYKIFRDGRPVSEPQMSKYIITILTELLLSNSTSSATAVTVVEDSISYINEHLAESLTLDSLSKRASLSPYYFSRVFTRETGMSPHQYIILSRVNSAKYLLKTTSLSIKEIAFSCGFTSESNFCYTFKKWEKVTPSDYRFSITAD